MITIFVENENHDNIITKAKFITESANSNCYLETYTINKFKFVIVYNKCAIPKYSKITINKNENNSESIINHQKSLLNVANEELFMQLLTVHQLRDIINDYVIFYDKLVNILQNIKFRDQPFIYTEFIENNQNIINQLINLSNNEYDSFIIKTLLYNYNTILVCLNYYLFF